jgi:hypothetical protein
MRATEVTTPGGLSQAIRAMSGEDLKRFTQERSPALNGAATP